MLSIHIACALLTLTRRLRPRRRLEPPAQGYKETISGTLVSFEMVPVPGGSVTVGGTTVKVEPFLIGRTEVTWDMYDLFAEGGSDVRGNTGSDASTRPSHPYGAPDYGWGHAGYPAISVTRQAAEAFCVWLSAKTGKTYRLPTEAEWARAAELAAGKDSTSASREAITWHRGNANATTHPVGGPQAGRARTVRPVRQRRRVGHDHGQLTRHARRLVPRRAREHRTGRAGASRTRRGTNATRSCRRAAGGCRTDHSSDSGVVTGK